MPIAECQGLLATNARARQMQGTKRFVELAEQSALVHYSLAFPEARFIILLALGAITTLLTLCKIESAKAGWPEENAGVG